MPEELEKNEFWDHPRIMCLVSIAMMAHKAVMVSCVLTLIKLLIQNPNYTYLISLNGDYDSGEQPVTEILPEAGLPSDIAAQGGLWVHTSQGERSYPGQTDMQYHMELEGTDLLVRRGREGEEDSVLG